MEAIKWCKDHILVLDQRKLPHEEVWVKISNSEQMAQAIQQMVLRGAPLIGIAAAYTLVLESHAARKNEVHSRFLEEPAERLCAARPTAVNLAWAVARMLKRAQESAATGESLPEALEKEACRIHLEDRQACEKIGKFGAALIPKGTVLTHCNTGALATGGEGTAYAVIREGFRQGKVDQVFVCEARPYLQGARLTAYELQQDRIPFTLITDSMAGHFMFSRRVNSVVVGADRIAANGDTANKIGSYTLSVLAKEHGIPFYVVAPTWTIDFSIPTGQNIRIEERDGREVLELLGVSIAPTGTKAAHPAFDVTPAQLISAFITEKGILKAPYSSSLVRFNQNELLIKTLPLK